MTFEHIHINLKRELIRTFAVVDEWFDKGHPLRCYKPSSGGWSVDEVLEHVMLTSHFLLIIIEKGTVKALQKYDPSANDDFVPSNYSLGNPALHEIADPKAFPWQRPEHHQPTGQRSTHEVRREIRNQLDRCLITLDLLPNGEGSAASDHDVCQWSGQAGCVSICLLSGVARTKTSASNGKD